MSNKIRVGIVGLGNCASALIQGLSYYHNDILGLDGLITPNIGGYLPGDIEVVTAFDIDERKVGKPVHEAMFAKPNCTPVFADELYYDNENPAMVKMGPIVDGFSKHLLDYPEDQRIVPSTQDSCDVVHELIEKRVHVLVNYLPVGSEAATQFYAAAALKAGCAFVNCIPVFIASDSKWAREFQNYNLPIIGDDIKSQVGATIVHRQLVKLFTKRGYKITKSYQLNVGGNTDFLNMKNQDRLKSKKISKTQSVQSQMPEMNPNDLHIGPSDYVPFLEDTKKAFIRVEGTGYGGAPISLECQLNVVDSPNSAGVVTDAIRYAKTALDKNMSGPLFIPSATLMKSPPIQFDDDFLFNAIDIDWTMYEYKYREQFHVNSGVK